MFQVKEQLFSTHIDVKVPQNMISNDTAYENSDLIREKKEKIFEIKTTLNIMEKKNYFTNDLLNEYINSIKEEMNLEHEINKEKARLRYEKELLILNEQHNKDIIIREKKIKNWCKKHNKKYYENQKKYKQKIKKYQNLKLKKKILKHQ